MGIQSRLGKETTGAPPAKGRSAAKLATLLTTGGGAAETRTASVDKELLENAIIGRQDDDDATATADGD